MDTTEEKKSCQIKPRNLSKQPKWLSKQKHYDITISIEGKNYYLSKYLFESISPFFTTICDLAKDRDTPITALKCDLRVFDDVLDMTIAINQHLLDIAVLFYDIPHLINVLKFCERYDIQHVLDEFVKTFKIMSGDRHQMKSQDIDELIYHIAEHPRFSKELVGEMTNAMTHWLRSQFEDVKNNDKNISEKFVKTAPSWLVAKCMTKLLIDDTCIRIVANARHDRLFTGEYQRQI